MVDLDKNAVGLQGECRFEVVNVIQLLVRLEEVGGFKAGAI